MQGVVQFDTPQNHTLPSDDDNQIKFWDVDNTNLLTCIEVKLTEACQSVSDLHIFYPRFPRLRFSKEANIPNECMIQNQFICTIQISDGIRSYWPLETFISPYEASAMKVRTYQTACYCHARLSV